jgi:hypothetical protein
VTETIPRPVPDVVAWTWLRAPFGLRGYRGRYATRRRFRVRFRRGWLEVEYRRSFFGLGR